MKPITVVIQARMGSSRFPGKVLQDLCGWPVLDWVVTRSRMATMVDEVVVATSDLPADDVIVDFCREDGVPCFRGSAEDVLDRYYSVASVLGAETIVRVTADCPFICPSTIDEVVETYCHSSHCDYVSNRLPPRRSAIGMDTEVFSFDALRLAWERCQDPDLREHVTPHLYLSGEVSIQAVHGEQDDSWMRLTLDTQDDLEFLSLVCDHFGDRSFRLPEIRKLLRANPEWVSVNSSVRQRADPN